jgi:hypothetical protein
MNIRSLSWAARPHQAPAEAPPAAVRSEFVQLDGCRDRAVPGVIGVEEVPGVVLRHENAIIVYVLALASAVRISSGALRAAAVVALALICVVGVFSSWYLFGPAVAALLSIGFRHTAARHVQDRRDQRERAGVPPTPVAPDAGTGAIMSRSLPGCAIRVDVHRGLSWCAQRPCGR